MAGRHLGAFQHGVGQVRILKVHRLQVRICQLGAPTRAACSTQSRPVSHVRKLVTLVSCPLFEADLKCHQLEWRQAAAVVLRLPR